LAKRPVFESAADAVAGVFDGATIMLGGFSANSGCPAILLRAVMETTTAKDLTFIGNGTPQAASGDPEHPFFAFDVSRVRKVICSFPVPNSTRRGIVNPYEAGFAEGVVELELVPQGTLAERMRAGGAGIPAFFTPTGVGTQLAEGKEEREFDGRKYVLERSLHADFALIKALKADTLGNLVYRNTARSFNPLMAMAADVTIAEVEEVVEAGELTPYEVVTPGIYVDRIFVARSGSK
jgi:3-oxoadipate CoA-transferase alpha subunit